MLSTLLSKWANYRYFVSALRNGRTSKKWRDFVPISLTLLLSQNEVVYYKLQCDPPLSSLNSLLDVWILHDFMNAPHLFLPSPLNNVILIICQLYPNKAGGGGENVTLLFQRPPSPTTFLVSVYPNAIYFSVQIQLCLASSSVMGLITVPTMQSYYEEQKYNMHNPLSIVPITEQVFQRH